MEAVPFTQSIVLGDDEEWVITEDTEWDQKSPDDQLNNNEIHNSQNAQGEKLNDSTINDLQVIDNDSRNMEQQEAGGGGGEAEKEEEEEEEKSDRHEECEALQTGEQTEHSQVDVQDKSIPGSELDVVADEEINVEPMDSVDGNTEDDGELQIRNLIIVNTHSMADNVDQSKHFVVLNEGAEALRTESDGAKDSFIREECAVVDAKGPAIGSTDDDSQADESVAVIDDENELNDSVSLKSECQEVEDVVKPSSKQRKYPKVCFQFQLVICYTREVSNCVILKF